MIPAIQKARKLPQSVRASNTGKVPRLWRPSYAGSTYYGQAFRWEQILHMKYWAFVAIKAWIREIAGGDPPNVGRIVPNKPGQKKVSKAFGAPKEYQNFEPYDDDHPLVQLFRNPNGPDVAYDLWAYTFLFKLLTGSAHWHVMKNGFGTPVEIWPIPTHWLRMTTEKDGMPQGYLIQSPWGGMGTIPFDEVISFYDHSPLNRWEGHAISQAIAEWLDAYESNVRARLAQYKNGAIPAFHVLLGESYGDPDEAFLARFYAKWLARFQGEDNTGRPLVTGPDVKVEPLGINPVDMRYVENEDQFRDNILAAYGVPKAVIGLTENMTFGGVKAARGAWRTYFVNPELTYMSQVITEKLIKVVDPQGTLWWDTRIDDEEAQLREVESRRAGGSITPNEERALFGAEPYPHGGDDPIIQGVPMPWVTGQKQDDGLDDGSIDLAFRRALGTGSGAAGGYTLEEKRHERNGNGKCKKSA